MSQFVMGLSFVILVSCLACFFFSTEDASESQKCVLNEKNVMRSVWSILDEMGEGELFAMLLRF